MKTWKCGCYSPKVGRIIPCEKHNHGKGIRIHSARLRRMAKNSTWRWN